MMLSRLAQAVPGAVLDGADVAVMDLSHDSREVSSGALFVAVGGRNTDGARFVNAAIEKGAVAVAAAPGVELDVEVPVLRLPNPRASLGTLAAALHGHPADALTLVGLTGTNGKTTVTTLLVAIFEAAGWVPGLIGTVEHRIGAERRVAKHTTPEAPTVHRLLREMVNKGVQATAMEVSSIGLAEHRVDGVRFSAAGFLNLTADHLNYHGDMAAYGAAKARLFSDHLRPGAIAVINGEDPFGAQLAAQHDGEVWRLGESVSWRALNMSAAGLRGVLQTPRGLLTLRSPMIGRFNADNVAMAAALALAVGVTKEAVQAGLAVAVARGRMEPIPNGTGVSVIVDYAHSADALRRAIAAITTPTRVVFGCGGDRDRSKRAPMGAAAATADVAILTTDNPRSEAPEAIAADALEGALAAGLTQAAVPAPGRIVVALDRREAIHLAIATANVGDTVLIAGKGHETYQEIAGVRRPFDDAQVAREALSLRGIGVEIFTQLPSARVLCGAAERITSVSIDTRTLEPGAAFFCLSGPNFDGHAYAHKAIAAGAVAVIADESRLAALDPSVTQGGALVISVPNTQEALAQAATRFASEHRVRTVGLTGSSGKTTTKELVAAVLSTLGQTLKTAGNLNNHLGVPLTLFRLRPEHRFAVIEMGMSAAGEIAALTRMARPEVGVVTSIGAAHLEGLGTLENVAKAKGELLAGLPATGLAIVPESVDQRTALLASNRARLVTVGGQSVGLSAVRETPTGAAATVTLDGESAALQLQLAGTYNLTNAALAIAVGHHYGASLALMITALEAVPAPALRGEVRTLADGTSVTLDCYNANPQSMVAAVQAFADRAPDGIAVVGDMLELGAESQALHREVGRVLAAHKTLTLVGVGPLGEQVIEGARAAGATQTHVAPSVGAAAEFLRSQSGRPVLLKASRGMRLERIYSALAGEGESA